MQTDVALEEDNVTDLRLTCDALDQAVTAGEYDLSPYEPSPAGLPTVASPGAAPTDRVGFTQIVQAIAAHQDLIILADEWPDIARAILDGGGDWPALAELIAIAPDDHDGATATGRRLQQQTEAELGDHPRLPFLDVIVGVIARGERLNDTVSAIGTYKLIRSDLLYWDGIDGRGADVIDSAEVLTELAAVIEPEDYQYFQYNDLQQILLIAEAERLIPPYSVNTALTRVITNLF